MDRIIINIKDHSKLSMFLDFLKLFQFIEVQSREKSEAKKRSKRYNFFDSAGMWEKREINSTQLRNKAWTRNR